MVGVAGHAKVFKNVKKIVTKLKEKQKERISWRQMRKQMNEITKKRTDLER